MALKKIYQWHQIWRGWKDDNCREEHSCNFPKVGRHDIVGDTSWLLSVPLNAQIENCYVGGIEKYGRVQVTCVLFKPYSPLFHINMWVWWLTVLVDYCKVWDGVWFPSACMCKCMNIYNAWIFREHLCNMKPLPDLLLTIGGQINHEANKLMNESSRLFTITIVHICWHELDAEGEHRKSMWAWGMIPELDAKDAFSEPGSLSSCLIWLCSFGWWPIALEKNLFQKCKCSSFSGRCHHSCGPNLCY